MKFLFLLYVRPEIRDDPDSLPGLEKWMAYGRELSEAGVHLGNNALEGLDTATTVRVRDGETLVTDGPFAETKEMLGGYYLIDVPDLDAALAWAAKIPSVGYGTVEVRPLMVFDHPS